MPKGHRSEPDIESSEGQQAEKAKLAEAQKSIGERVKFWEEQDKINQVLIDRVIRQNNLLCDHIKDHESLPMRAEAAVRTAIAEARREQKKQYEAALAAIEHRRLIETRRHRKGMHWLVGIVAAVSITLSITAIFLALNVT